jgi:hypothetical protein
VKWTSYAFVTERNLEGKKAIIDGTQGLVPSKYTYKGKLKFILHAVTNTSQSITVLIEQYTVN